MYDGLVRRLLRGLFLATLFLVIPTVASAQTNNPCADASGNARCLELQLFLPTPNVGTTFTIDTPGVPRHLTFVVGANLSMSSGMLTRVDPGDVKTQVVETHFQAEVMAAIGLFEFVELGLVLPFAVNSALPDAINDTVGHQTNAGLSDLRVLVKVPFLRGDFALSGRTVLTLPTSTNSENFLGTGYWSFYPNLIASYDLGRVDLGAELGYRFRRRASIGALEQDDELQGNIGASIGITDWLAGILEAQLRLGVGGQTFEANENPADANVGVRLDIGGGLFVDLGAGFGLLSGYGAPNVRGFGILRYATEDEPCVAGPEDFDGFEDGDFCADPDNDRDGIEDDDDDCPNDAEDIDQFLDGDGCPDADNDADGVLDAADQCPIQSEDIDGYQDEDGCPDEDNDGDGIPDGLDQCPMDPEDQDGYQDDDGCPEPGPERATVTVTDTRILISERVYFDFDRDTIRSVSMPLLDQVASVVGQLPAGRRVRVEGYTDNNGEDRYNTDLSYRRARSVVEYLASQGVPRSRLDYVGYGERNPVAPNDSPEGRSLNRRVEFTILHAGEESGQGARRRRRPRPR